MKEAAEIVMECLKKKGLPQRQLAERMGEDVRYLNQQLKRQNDMKCERFAEVMQYIGYTVDIEDIGCQRVSPDYAKQIIETREPKGLFWHKEDDGYFIGIDNSDGNAWIEEFANQEECIKYLLGKPCITAEGSELNE